MPKLQSVLKLTERILDFLGDAGAFIARLMLVLMTGLVVVDVVARYAFNSPLGFAGEYVMYLMVGVTLIGAGWVLREKGNISVDIVVRLLPLRAHAWLLAATDVLSIFLVALLLIPVIKLTGQSFASQSISVTPMSTPLGIVQLILPIGFGLLLLEFLRVATISIRAAICFGKIKQDTEKETPVEAEGL